MTGYDPCDLIDKGATPRPLARSSAGNGRCLDKRFKCEGEVRVSSIVRVGSLASFLQDGDQSLDAISRFLVLDTFVELNPMGISLGLLRSNGNLEMLSGFGYDSQVLHGHSAIPMRKETPMTKAIRFNRLVELNNSQSFESAHPSFSHSMFPEGFAAAVAFPLHSVGAGILFLEKKFRLTAELRAFITTVGSIVALEIAKRQDITPKFNGLRSAFNADTSSLTNREQVILGLIITGATNIEIASEIGFSESLVRQETIAIYNLLGVSGRKEILERVSEDPDIFVSAITEGLTKSKM